MSANIFLGANHDRCKSLATANKLSAVMRKPMQNGDASLVVSKQSTVNYGP